MFLLCTSSESSLFVAVSFKHPIPTPDYSQISKELINFYDSAYIKAMDVSGSASKDSAIKVLDVFHKTVRNDGGKKSSLSFFFGPAALFLKWQGTEILLTSCSCVFFLVQLDCCGKGDDTALFLQLATTLCPTKSPEDFHLRTQVCTNLLLSSHSFSICN